MEISNKTILITGATGGLGRELSIQFAKKAQTMILLARNKQKLEKLGLTLKIINQDLEVQSYTGDLSKVNDLDKVTKRIKEKNKSIDILVNNAGIGSHAKLLRSEIEETEHILNLNLLAPLRISISLLTLLNNPNQSYIVNIGSIAGEVALPYMGAYSISKAGLKMFSNTVRLEGYDSSIKVLHVSLGSLDNKNFSKNLLSSSSGFKNKHFKSDPKKVAVKIIRAVESNKSHLTYPWYYRGAVLLDRAVGRLGDYLKRWVAN